MLPISLRNSLGNLLSTVVEFVMPNNQIWSIYYRRNLASFIFIKEFASFYGLKENFIVVFEYLGNSRFLVRIYDQRSVEISYISLSKRSKRDGEIFMKLKYHFGFPKGGVIDVIGFEKIKGNHIPDQF